MTNRGGEKKKDREKDKEKEHRAAGGDEYIKR